VFKYARTAQAAIRFVCEVAHCYGRFFGYRNWIETDFPASEKAFAILLLPDDGDATINEEVLSVDERGTFAAEKVQRVSALFGRAKPAERHENGR